MSSNNQIYVIGRFRIPRIMNIFGVHIETMIIIPMIVTIFGIIFMFDPLNVISGIYTFLCIFVYTFCYGIKEGLTHLIFPLLNIIIQLLHVATELLYALAVLIIGAIGLLIACLYNCPSEESFDSWLKSFIAFSMDNEPIIGNNQSSTNETDSTWKSSLNSITNKVTNYAFKSFAPTIMSNTIFGTRKFWYVGAFRLAFCTMFDKKTMIFVGVLNTWLPWGER